MSIDFKHPEGDTLSLEFPMVELDGKETDLTESTCSFLVSRIGSLTVTTYTEGNGITISDPTNGIIKVTIPAGVLTSKGIYRYELHIDEGDGVVRTPRFGNIHVTDTLFV